VGTSHGDFVKFPRTPHLFGSTGTSDDRFLDEQQSLEFLDNDSLIVEEKIDGANVGIHISDERKLILQCRGHLITEGMHGQYDLFKQWATAKQHALAEFLGRRYILYGEWMYARHTIHYRRLPHYFLAFDIYDKEADVFLDHERRSRFLQGTNIPSVPILHAGPASREQLEELLTASTFGGQFVNPISNRIDALAEGLYLRIEEEGLVAQRAKHVRPEFVAGVEQNTHWRHQAIVPNRLVEGADIWR
jgi:hypothetical protein